MRTWMAWVLLLPFSGGCVIGNQAPSTPRVELHGVDRTQDLKVTVVRASIDPDGDPVSYRYNWTRDGEPAPEMKSDVVPAADLRRGERWGVAVIATDGEDRSEPGTAEATILNALPAVQAAVSPESPETDQDLIASGDSSDADGDAVTLSYAWLLNGSKTSFSTATIAADQTSEGQHWEVQVTPYDGIDQGPSNAASVTIGNQAPTLEAITLTPSQPGTEDALEAMAIARDADQDPITVSWVWMIDGVVVQEGPSARLDPSHTRRGVFVQVQGTPNDGMDEGAALTSESLEVGNTAPRVGAILLSSDTVTQDDTLTVLAVDATDADGDPITLGYDWRADGVPVGTGDVLSVEGLWEGAQIVLEVTADDGLDAAAPALSSEVLVLNTPPRVSGAAIQPLVAYAQDTLWVALEIDDPDDDPLTMTYTWHVEGLEVQTGTQDTLAELFERDQEVSVSVDVDDGTHPTVTRTASRYIVNAPPSLEAAVLSRSTLQVGDTLGCDAEGAADPDGDTVTIVRDWYVNSFRVAETELLTDDVFRRGDEVWCALTPSDGTIAGDPVESTHLIVENAPPSTVDAVIVYEGLRQGVDGLRCTWEDSFPTDPEGDLVGIRALWSADGLAFEGDDGDFTGDTIRPEDTTVATDWSCVLESYDVGYEDGATGAPDAVTMAPVGGNVLILLADDVGNDMIGAYAEHPNPPPTPRIDALAAEGLLFRNAYAQPVCSPTRAALLTGRHGRRYGIGVIIDRGDYVPPVPTSERMIPDVLRESPEFFYTSSLTGKWHLSSAILGPEHPGTSGFDWYAGAPENIAYRADIEDGVVRNYEHWVKNTNGLLTIENTYATTDTVDDALDRIGAMPEPWFLYVPFNAAHSPVHIPPEGLYTEPLTEEDDDATKFRGVVEAMDTEIGRLLDGIPADVRDRTTVVFLGDNGTPDWAITEPRTAPQHKGTVYEGGTNVPMIVTSPLLTSPGETTEGLVHVVDVFATVTALAGIDAHALTRSDLLGGPDQAIVTDGVSFLPYLNDPHQPSIRPYVYTERFLENGEGPYLEDRRSLRDERWKLIVTRSLGDEPEELFFDLAGVDVEGENLLTSDEPMSDEALAAYEVLSDELTVHGETLTYDVPALAPIVIGPSLTPDPPSTSEDVVCAYAFLGDPNHDPVTLEILWDVNGIPLVGFTDDVLPAGIAGSGDVLTCTLTPHDEFLTGESVSATTTVL